MLKRFSLLIPFIPFTLHAETLQCPPSITVTESTSSLSHWESTMVTSKKNFKGWSIFLKKPDGQFEQAPLSVEKDKKSILTWELNSDENYWLECHYENTTLTLRQKIPNNIKQCKQIYLIDGKHNAIAREKSLCE